MNIFDQFTDNHISFSIIIIVALGIWLFGKHFIPWSRLIKTHLVLSALVDLITAPIMILFSGSLVRNILERFSKIDLNDQVINFSLLCLLLAIAWCFARFTEIFFLSKRKQNDASYLPGLQRGLLFGGFLFLGFISFLYLKGFSITGIYVSTGAAAALIAFAMQRTLGDLFSGIALSIEHPFKLGDRIRLADGLEGKVIDINWRATRLLSWDNSTLVVPNSELAQQGFKNLHGFDHTYAPWYEIKLPAEVDPRLAQALLLEAALRCEKVLKNPLPVVRLIDATTVPYTYMIWVHFPNYPSMFAGREELFHEIHYTLKNVGAQVSPDVHELHSQQVEKVYVKPPTTLIALKILDITKSFSEEELKKLAEMSTRKTYEIGTVLASEGDIAESVDVIIHGVVESSIQTKTSGSKVVEQLKSGQYFGLSSMIMDTPSFLQFTASTNVTLIHIDTSCLRKILTDRPDLHEMFAEIMKQRMDAAQDVRLASEKTETHHTFRDVLHRIEMLVR